MIYHHFSLAINIAWCTCSMRIVNTLVHLCVFRKVFLNDFTLIGYRNRKKKTEFPINCDKK